MINSKTEGFIAAPMTAYRPDGTIYPDIIPMYAEFLQFNGVVGVFINGTTGEGFSLTVEERKDIAEQWVKAGSDKFRIALP